MKYGSLGGGRVGKFNKQIIGTTSIQEDTPLNSIIHAHSKV